MKHETGRKIDIVINIQGDEPFIKPEQIDLVKDCFTDENVQIATLVRKAEPGEDIFNPNQPKVILNTEGDAIYFSRAAIPFIREAEKSEWTRKHSLLQAYRTLCLQNRDTEDRSPG